MTLSAFSIVKNEAQFIGYGLMSILPYVDEVVYADGNSTDGTLELLDYIREKYDPAGKIRVLRGWDCADLKDDYVRLFNDLLKQCKGDYLWFAHPDMVLTDPGRVRELGKDGALAYFTQMRSFAGESLDREIVRGRTMFWKNIMRNDFGLHYAGHYGAPDEDMYFSDITGEEHVVYKEMKYYPYVVEDSGMRVDHYCECKPRARRADKMAKVLAINYGVEDTHLKEFVDNHPRVHLESQSGMFGDFEFAPRPDALPAVFSTYKAEFDAVLGRRDEKVA